MDICSSMFARKKNIPPRNRGRMQQILRCRGVPRCGAAAPHQSCFDISRRGACATCRNEKNPRYGDRSGGAGADFTMG